MPSSQKFHFISGLPRSGSTLLSALLRQNPKFHADISSPVSGLIQGMISQFSAGSEFASLITPQQREDLLNGVFDSYYKDHTEDVIFDTNRSWNAQLPDLMKIHPDSKVICLVRNVAWVMDSLERQYRDNSFENTLLFSDPATRSTVYTRVESLANANSLVGYPWHALREACYSEYADRLVLVDYDLLTGRPAEVMGLLYEFLGEEPFAHDFENVEFSSPEFDANLGVNSLHQVHPKVQPMPRESLLPPDLFEKYASLSFWQNLPQSRAFRIVSDAEISPGGDVSNVSSVKGAPDHTQHTA